jgi:hypothetical protein
MTMSGHASTGSAELRAIWEAWARRRYGDEPELIRIVTNAAVRAAMDGATSEDAALAAQAAARSFLNGSAIPASGGANDAPRSRSGPSGRDNREVATSSIAQSGAPRGRAIRVDQRQALQNGLTIHTLDIALASPNGRSFGFTMRGTQLSGSVREGDDIEVVASRLHNKVPVATHIYNHTTCSDVTAGPGGFFSSQSIMMKVFITVFVTAWVIGFIIVMMGVLGVFDPVH